MCTFFCSGVCAIDRDSVMQETTSSAASALSKQNSIASLISPLRGVSPLSKVSNLSLCLRHNKHSQYAHTLQNQTYVGSLGAQTSQAYVHFIFKEIEQHLFLSERNTCLLCLQVPFPWLFLLNREGALFWFLITMEIWVKKRWLPKRATPEHFERWCSPFIWLLSLKEGHRQNVKQFS